MDMLTLSHVSKSFGKNTILRDLCFSVPEHSVFGFIGQNGAGKTTTMKIILGLLQADGGTITVHNKPVSFGQTKTNQYIGYLPDIPEFYGFMTPAEYLNLCGEITGMSVNDIHDRSVELLKLVGLEHCNKRISVFSRGMKQRLGIAQALLNRPKLLICDEPTSALDPAGRKEILDILHSVKKDTTVLFSTHILSDVERICDKIAFLHQGSIALQGTLDEIKQLHQGTGFEAEFFTPEDATLFSSLCPHAQQINKRILHFKKGTSEDMQTVMQLLIQNQISVQRLEMMEPTLETLFMEVIQT